MGNTSESKEYTLEPFSWMTLMKLMLDNLNTEYSAKSVWLFLPVSPRVFPNLFTLMVCISEKCS